MLCEFHDLLELLVVLKQKIDESLAQSSQPPWV